LLALNKQPSRGRNKNEQYTFCFWNDYNIPKLVNQKYYDECNVLAMKADILRYELLYFFGGIYVDCDFLSLKSIDNLIKSLGFDMEYAESILNCKLL
jgi:mannosyltransferase OCH1-like enzyme